MLVRRLASDLLKKLIYQCVTPPQHTQGSAARVDSTEA